MCYYLKKQGIDPEICFRSGSKIAKIGATNLVQKVSTSEMSLVQNKIDEEHHMERLWQKKNRVLSIVPEDFRMLLTHGV